MTFEEQIKLLNTAPDVDLITPADQYIKAPYLSGAVIIHTLNEIFGPTGWGYELLDWPELFPIQDGRSGVYRCRGRVWFRFDGHDLIERYVPGLCAVRPRSGESLDSVIFEQRRMGYQGAITDMIKNAAGTLGVRLGLGLNDQLLRPKLRLGAVYKDHSPAEAREELYGSGNGQGQAETTAESSGGNNSNAKTTAWILDEQKRKGFWVGVREKGLTHDFVHEALAVESLKDYRGSVSDAWTSIKAAIDAGKEGQSGNGDAFDGAKQQAIPF